MSMNAKAMVRDAEKLAQAMVQDAAQSGMSYEDLIQIVAIALRLLRATYPGTARESLALLQVADATFQAVLGEDSPN